MPAGERFLEDLAALEVKDHVEREDVGATS